jgi:hypothetical protein
MLLWLYTHVSVACFKCFICFRTHVASILSECCICYKNSYVASVYSECFICFSCMLQLFHLSVAKVDLNVCVEEV